MTQRVVATLTTLPDRYDLLRNTLKSIVFQVDVVYLTLPLRAKRLNQEYPPLPDDITTMCRVIRTEFDYGPIMKLYGALLHERDPTTLIISVDDDIIYPPNLVASFLRRHQEHP